MAAGSSSAAAAWCWWTARRRLPARARPEPSPDGASPPSRAWPAHPLVAAFLDEQAGQCGYCLSGIIVSAKALLDRQPAPSRAEIIAALDPHLCRCGAHNRIIRGIERAGAAARESTA